MSFHHLSIFSITTLSNVCWVFLIREKTSQHSLVCSFWTAFGKNMKFMVLIHVFVSVVECPFVCAMKSVFPHAHLTLRRIYFKQCLLLSLCFYREVNMELSTFTYSAKILGGDLKNSHWKVFEKGMKAHMMSHVKMHSPATYRILLPYLENLPWT